MAPGHPTSTLTINGSLMLRGTTLMEVNKSGVRLTHDLVNGTGFLNYGGTLTVLAGGDPLVAGDTFKLFNAAKYSGTFARLKLPTLDAGLSWDTSGLTTNGAIAVTAGTPIIRP